MPKIRCDGYVLLSWSGDHTPPHVHVYRNGELIVKWDLERWRPMVGAASRRLRRLLWQLHEEGRL